MGRTIGMHYFYVIVPTCYADEIVSRWGWGYCEDVYSIPDSSRPYYQSVATSEESGATRFVFISDTVWESEKMFDDVYDISAQLVCNVLTLYIQGGDGITEPIKAELIVPGDLYSKTHNAEVLVTTHTVSLKDVLAIHWNDDLHFGYQAYTVTDAFDNPSFKPDARFMKNQNEEIKPQRRRV